MNGWKAGLGKVLIGMLVLRRDGHVITMRLAKCGVEIMMNVPSVLPKEAAVPVIPGWRVGRGKEPTGMPVLKTKIPGTIRLFVINGVRKMITAPNVIRTKRAE